MLVREENEHVAAQDRSPWDRSDGWTIGGRRSRRLSFRHGADRYDVVLWYGRDGLTMEARGTKARLQFVARAGALFDLCLGDAPERASAAWSGRDLVLTTPRGHLELHWVDPFVADAAEAAAATRVVAPMPGTVTRILAEPEPTFGAGRRCSCSRR